VLLVSEARKPVEHGQVFDILKALAEQLLRYIQFILSKVQEQA
jgi:hypothetical protein